MMTYRQAFAASRWVRYQAAVILAELAYLPAAIALGAVHRSLWPLVPLLACVVLAAGCHLGARRDMAAASRPFGWRDRPWWAARCSGRWCIRPYAVVDQRLRPWCLRHAGKTTCVQSHAGNETEAP